MLIENTDYREEFLNLNNPFDVKLVKEFLHKLDFNFIPESVDETIILFTLNDDIVGTGSLQNNVLKYIAVAPKYRETAAFAMIVSQLTEKAIANYNTLFVFTKPRNVISFKGLGFKHIATAEPYYSLLEYGTKTIKHYQNKILEYKQETKSDNVASIVMNCNPFTNGHKFLIEQCSKENEVVYLFVVEEDLSVFPFKTRWELIKKGISHLNNVVMIPGGDYIVSGKTFPSYFLKGIDEQEIAKNQSKLDINIFCQYIAPTLGIKKRYVGTETYCQTTAQYNDTMRELLPQSGIELVEIERVTETVNSEQEYISASKVRQAIKNDELEKYWNLIPKVTQDFFNSPESDTIKELIKKSDSRH